MQRRGRDSGLCIMDEFAAASRTGQAGLISKCLERCYLYRELEGLQEQQQEEEEEEEQGPLTGTLAVPKYHPGPCSLVQAKNTS